VNEVAESRERRAESREQERESGRVGEKENGRKFLRVIPPLNPAFAGSAKPTGPAGCKK